MLDWKMKQTPAGKRPSESSLTFAVPSRSASFLEVVDIAPTHTSVLLKALLKMRQTKSFFRLSGAVLKWWEFRHHQI
jgi:hypothetical protein